MKRLAILIAVAAFLSGSTAVAETPAKHAESIETRPRMDVVFTIDATGSMGDEIDVIKKEVWAIANKLVSGKPSPDIRFGLVLYRDLTEGDDKVEVTPLTRDIDAIHEKLMAAQAMGGGDKPEHIGLGLHESLDLDWDLDPTVKRSIYLVGDAGASKHETHTVASALDEAAQKNITINAIGCSGLQPHERTEFTGLASRTGGTFEALTYYAVVEGDDGKKKSVVYYDGEMYETDGVISEKEWKSGGEKVISKRKMKKAKGETASRAAAAPKRNNLDSVVFEDMKVSAESMGVDY